MLYGSNPEIVIEAIRNRARDRREGSADSHGRKLGLVIEGGGMRSVLSGAGALALARLGLGGVFDEIYATSAGVMNASYLITDQASLGMSVYFENCPTWSFLNPARVWKMLDVDYIIDEVAGDKKRLDVEALVAAQTRLLVPVCDTLTGQVVLIDVKATSTPILDVLRAAMALPVFYNRVVTVDGLRCVDSGTILPFAIEHAISRKCTDIFVLLTRPASFQELPPTLLQRQIFNVIHASRRRHLGQAFGGRMPGAQRVRELALGRTSPSAGVNIATICPEEGCRIESMTTDPRLTQEAAISYGRQTFRCFGEDPDGFDLGLPGIPARGRG
jgi:predicted patatin/cPLA2 family phospholipase